METLICQKLDHIRTVSACISRIYRHPAACLTLIFRGSSQIPPLDDEGSFWSGFLQLASCQAVNVIARFWLLDNARLYRLHCVISSSRNLVNALFQSAEVSIPAA